MIGNQYIQVPHLTQDTTWGNDKNTRKHHTQESQEVSPFQAGDHKAAMNRQDSMTDTKHKYQKRIHKRITVCYQGWHRLEKYLNLEGFLEKSLKIKSALKSTGKSLQSL